MRVVDGADPYSINPSIANRQNKKRHFHSVSAQTSPTPANPIMRACTPPEVCKEDGASPPC